MSSSFPNASPSVMLVQQSGLPVFVLVSFVLLVGCAGEGMEKALTRKEKNTLDPTLQRIVQGDTSAVEQGRIGTTDDGEGLYAVFIHVTDREVFRERNFSVNSWSGSIATARMTLEQIRRAARMEVVYSIQLSGRAEAHE